MSVFLAVAAFVTVGGALVAVVGRDARVALVGLVVALAAAPFLADPLPDPAPLAVRIVAAALAGYLLFVVLRETTVTTRGSLIGLPAETLAAAAAFVVGYGTSGLCSAALGPAWAHAAGYALAVIAVAPIVRGADVFRLGVALAILMTGAELVRVGLAGTPSPLEQLVTAGLTIGLLGTVAVLCANAVAATGGLALDDEPRREALFEAHPVAAGARCPGPRSWRPRRPERAWRPVRSWRQAAPIAASPGEAEISARAKRPADESTDVTPQAAASSDAAPTADEP